MNKKFVYQVGNNKKSYTMMHGQPNIKVYSFVIDKLGAGLCVAYIACCQMFTCVSTFVLLVLR